LPHCGRVAEVKRGTLLSVSLVDAVVVDAPLR
jgi:hypothetical protein